jgi:hypothetical protein
MAGNGGASALKSQSVAGRHMELRYTERKPWFNIKLWKKRTWATVIAVLAIIGGLLAAAGIFIPKQLERQMHGRYGAKTYALGVECEFCRDVS